MSLVVNFAFEDPKYAWIEPAAIMAAVSACTLVAAGNDYQKEKQFIELNKVAEDKKKVLIIIIFNFKFIILTLFIDQGNQKWHRIVTS